VFKRLTGSLTISGDGASGEWVANERAEHEIPINDELHGDLWAAVVTIASHHASANFSPPRASRVSWK